MTFDLAEFLTPLDPFVLLMSFVLGVSLGIVLRLMHHHLSRAAIFWQLAGGAVFFVPLSLLRALQGSTVWERFLATLVLWAIFVFGMWVGSRDAHNKAETY